MHNKTAPAYGYATIIYIQTHTPSPPPSSTFSSGKNKLYYARGTSSWGHLFAYNIKAFCYILKCGHGRIPGHAWGVALRLTAYQSGRRMAAGTDALWSPHGSMDSRIVVAVWPQGRTHCGRSMAAGTDALRSQYGSMDGRIVVAVRQQARSHWGSQHGQEYCYCTNTSEVV